MRKIEFRALQSVFKSGDLSDDIYFLTKGEVGIFLPDNNTKEPNFTIGENEIFGEMGVIEDELRMGEARCMTACEILAVSKKEFDDKVSQSDLFVRGVLRILSYRLRTLQKTR